MSSDDASDLFEIKLSGDGIKYIRKFARLVKFVVISGILISIASISSGIYYLLGNKVDYSALDYSKRLYFNLFPFFQCLHSLLFLVQLYFYWRFKKYILTGVNYKSETNFNRAFHELYKNGVWAIVTMAVAFIFAALDFIFILAIS
jgi:magnesium-transporting ATPase (P-type)